MPLASKGTLKPTARRRLGEDDKEAMLRAAERLVVETRLRGLTTNAIAAESGYAVASLYKLLGPLDQIVLLLLARRRHALEALLPSAALPGDRFAYLKSLIEAVLRFYADEPELVVLLDLEEQRLDSEDALGPRGLLHRTLREQLFSPRMPRIADPELASAYLCGLILCMSRDAVLLRRPSNKAYALQILVAANGLLSEASWMPSS